MPEKILQATRAGCKEAATYHSPPRHDDGRRERPDAGGKRGEADFGGNPRD